jgi:DNA-binding FrmR family transcriptional regulator
MIDDALQKKGLAALRRIEGQVRGVARMIEDRRYCIDIVTQASAAEAALHRVGAMVLRKHMETCVMEAFRSGRKGDAREKVDELMRVYGQCRAK